MKTILSILTALTITACVADPSDDLGHSRDLRTDDNHGDFYDGVDQAETPSMRDTEHGALDETLDNEITEDADDVTAMPETLTVAR